MRNYWLKILLGALGVFALGMIGVSLVRGGIAKVHSVVEGEGPITIPLSLIPFVLGGERLGNLERVTLNRESPSRVTDVELEVKLTDSLLAHGLAGCRLAANLEGDNTHRGVNIRVNRKDDGAFHCVPADSTPADLVEYGVAIFHPGDVQVPLLLSTDIVAELQSLDFGHDSAGMTASDSLQIPVPNADSIKAEVARQVLEADSIRVTVRKFADSVRQEARRQLAAEADSE